MALSGSTLGLPSQVYTPSSNSTGVSASGKPKGKRLGPNCQIHKNLGLNEQAKQHYTWNCPQYFTAEAKRKFWDSKGICQKCLKKHKLDGTSKCIKLRPCQAMVCGEPHLENLCDLREAEMNSKLNGKPRKLLSSNKNVNMLQINISSLQQA